jgi:hypothetical protein
MWAVRPYRHYEGKMADPTHYLTAKIASAIGGLIGGFGMMTFVRPKTISEAFTRGGVSTGAAIIFAGPLLSLMEIPANWEMQLMSGGIIGFLSYSLLGAVANFFRKNQEKDIFELADTARSQSKRAGKPKGKTSVRKNKSAMTKGSK